MSEYTPTTEQVRFAYSYDPEADYRDPLTNHTHQHEREFDRWLAAHDERVRTEERERCAQIAEDAHFGGGPLGQSYRWAAKQVAAAIRAVFAEQEGH